jgi:ribosome-associated protein
VSESLFVDRRVTLPGDELEWHAVRASGPGGQNVNKVASKVELRFNLPGSRVLSAAVKERLGRLGKGRLDADGWLFVVDQSTRDQRRNLDAARRKLAELVRRALTPPKKRKPTAPTVAARRRRLEQKRRQSSKKQGRTRVRGDDN